MSAAPFVPANPEFGSVVRESFSRQTMMATLGAGITEFLACGRVLRPGRTLTVCLAEVLAIVGDDRSPIATMLSTIIVRPRAPR